METVNTVSLLATVYDSKLSIPSVLLPFYLNAVPASVRRRCLAHSPKERSLRLAL